MATCLHPNYMLSTTAALIQEIKKSIPHAVLVKHAPLNKSLEYYRSQALYVKSLKVSNVGIAFPKKNYLDTAQRDKMEMASAMSDSHLLTQYKFKKNQEYLRSINKLYKKYNLEDTTGGFKDKSFLIVSLGTLGIPVETIDNLYKFLNKSPHHKQAGGGFMAKMVIDQILLAPNPMTKFSMMCMMIGTIGSNAYIRYDPNSDQVIYDFERAKVDPKIARCDDAMFAALTSIITMIILAALMKNNQVTYATKAMLTDLFEVKKSFMKKLFGTNSKVLYKKAMEKAAPTMCKDMETKPITSKDGLYIFDYIMTMLKDVIDMGVNPSHDIYVIVKQHFQVARDMYVSMVPHAPTPRQPTPRQPTPRQPTPMQPTPMQPPPRQVDENVGKKKVKVQNAYIYFGKMMRPGIKAEHPEYKPTQITKAIAEKWRAMSDQEKDQYKYKDESAPGSETKQEKPKREPKPRSQEPPVPPPVYQPPPVEDEQVFIRLARHFDSSMINAMKRLGSNHRLVQLAISMPSNMSMTPTFTRQVMAAAYSR
jgi:hypothetical protein